MPASLTAYDRVAYPSSTIPASHPDHLAAIARLHGLTPPPPATARVLDIGGGDGMNLLSMAEGLPHAHFLNIDLAATPVARGQAIAATAGLTNVRVKVADILDAAHTLEGPFDYIIAHGVYAWVPPVVREAVLALIGRVLSPDGIAFVSYNAFPGAYYRLMLREMLLHALDGISGTDARRDAAIAFMQDFAKPRENDLSTLVPLRSFAELTKDGYNVLFHDELGEVYAPQSLTDVAAAAAMHGLRFLNDAEPKLLVSGLPDEPIEEARIIHSAQGHDFETMCLFHKTLFVRAEQTPARSLDADRVRDLYIGAPLDRTGPNSFASRRATVTLADQTLVDTLAAAAEAWPARLRVGDRIDDDDRLAAIVRLFRGDVIELHTLPFPGAAVAGDHPRATSLARTLVALGETQVFSLDQRRIDLDPVPRAFLSLLDGTRDRAALACDWAAAIGESDVSVDDALVRLAKLALLVA